MSRFELADLLKSGWEQHKRERLWIFRRNRLIVMYFLSCLLSSVFCLLDDVKSEHQKGARIFSVFSPLLKIKRGFNVFFAHERRMSMPLFFHINLSPHTVHLLQETDRASNNCVEFELDVGVESGGCWCGVWWMLVWNLVVWWCGTPQLTFASHRASNNCVEFELLEMTFQ